MKNSSTKQRYAERTRTKYFENKFPGVTVAELVTSKQDQVLAVKYYAGVAPEVIQIYSGFKVTVHTSDVTQWNNLVMIQSSFS